MTRQAFLAQMPVPPPSTALCLSRFVPRQSLFLSLSPPPSVVFTPGFSPFPVPFALSGPLSPPSHQKSRAIALGGLSTLTDSFGPIQPRDVHTFYRVRGPHDDDGRTKSKPLCPYTPRRRARAHGKTRARGRPSGNAVSVCVIREPEKERGSERRGLAQRYLRFALSGSLDIEKRLVLKRRGNERCLPFANPEWIDSRRHRASPDNPYMITRQIEKYTMNSLYYVLLCYR